MKTRSHTPYVLIVLISWIILLLVGCAQETPAATPTPQATATEQTTEEAAVTQTPLKPATSPSYAVVWVPKGENLVIRQPAGISGTEVGMLEWNAKNVKLTGNRTLLGSSLWVEIQFGVDGLGWVNSFNITETVLLDDLCNDTRVIDMLNVLRTAIEEEDDIGLSRLLNNNRGLSLRLNWYSPDVRFTVEEVTNLFSNPDEFEWGVMADSGFSVVGTFRDVMFPKLEDVFLRSPEATCNALKFGSTNGEIYWPEDLTNLKFYGIYRKPVSDGNEFDWRSWAVGIEYADGNPFVAVLIHYSSEL